MNYEEEMRKNEEEKRQAIEESNSMYDTMINDSEKYYQDQIDATKEYEEEQKKIQNEQTEQAINEIEQKKGYLEKDYQREQRGAYTDWQRESNRYGVNAEQQAASGLTNTGYSESSQVSMYNTYQNRVATARESYQRAVVDYDNAIANARIANNAALAEIAYNALQATLELSLQGFQYKNTLLTDRLNRQQALDTEYYGRYRDLYTQAEQVRQFNEQMKFQKEQAAQAQKNWEKEYQLSLKATSSRGSSGGRSSGGSSKNKSSGGSVSLNGNNNNSSLNSKGEKIDPKLSRSRAQSSVDNLKKLADKKIAGVKAGSASFSRPAWENQVKLQLGEQWDDGLITYGDLQWALKQLGLE
jgi:hypothetical protein